MRIWQLNEEDARLMFLGYNAFVKATGDERLDRNKYCVVWDERGQDDAELEEVFERFNADIPAGFMGHSLSVGDVVENKHGLFFCDTFGWKKVEWRRPEGPTIKGVRIEPGKPAEPAEITNTLEGLQFEVEGYIEATYPFEDNVVVFGNEEAKLIWMEGNRRINGQIYAGPIIIVGDDGQGENVDLTEAQVKRYVEMFAEPEDIPDEETQADVGFTFISF